MTKFNKERWKHLNVDQKIISLDTTIGKELGGSLGVLATMLDNLKQMRLKDLLENLNELEKSFYTRLNVLSKQASNAAEYIKDRDGIEENPPSIFIPFAPIRLVSNDILVIGSRPVTPRTFFSIQIIEENSVRSDLKGLAYFIGTQKQRTIANSGKGKILHECPNLNLQFESFGVGDQLILNLKRQVQEWKPQYVVLDGLDKVFPVYNDKEQLVKDVNVLLSDLRQLSDRFRLPIIISTHVLFGADIRGYKFEPMLAYFGSDVLEIISDFILTLDSPYASSALDITAEDSETRDLMQLHILKPFSQARIPYEFKIDRDTNRFYPIKSKE